MIVVVIISGGSSGSRSSLSIAAAEADCCKVVHRHSTCGSFGADCCRGVHRHSPCGSFGGLFRVCYGQGDGFQRRLLHDVGIVPLDWAASSDATDLRRIQGPNLAARVAGAERFKHKFFVCRSISQGDGSLRTYRFLPC